jgi:hypothetical protein
LTVSPAQLSFGEVWEESRFPWVLTFHNSSQQDAVVEQFATECDCVQIEPQSLTIPVGGASQVRLILDLTPQGKDIGGAKRYSIATSIGAKLQGESRVDSKHVWEIRGIVRPVIQFSTPTLNLGRISELVSSDKGSHVEVGTDHPVERLHIWSSSKEFRVNADRSKTNASRFVLSVFPQKGLSKGEKNVDIHVTPYDKEGKPLGTRILPLLALVVDDVQFSPPERVLFGIQAVGARLEEIVTLQSLVGQKVLSIEKCRCEGKGITAEATPSSENGLLTLAIRLQLLETGAFTGKVIATVRSEDGPGQDVELAVTAYGIETKTPEK